MVHAISQHGYSERRACRLMLLNRRTFRRPAGPDRDEDLRKRLRELSEERRSFGSPRLCILLRREGLLVNHKQVERVYREEGLSLRLKRRRKRPSHLRVVQPGPSGPDEQWPLDFVSDSLISGRRLRLLTIVELWDRSCSRIELDHSLPGERVVRVLDALRLGGRKPSVLRMDKGPKLTGKALDRWAHEHGVLLDFIRPGRPMDNGHIESFNGRLREECLNLNVFVSLADARRMVEAWRQDYNRERPHSALAGLSPEQFRASYYGNIKDQAVTNLSVGYQAGVRSDEEANDDTPPVA